MKENTGKKVNKKKTKMMKKKKMSNLKWRMRSTVKISLINQLL